MVSRAAADLARLIGYADSKQVSHNVRKKWKNVFAEGEDFFFVMVGHGKGAGCQTYHLPQNATKTLFLTRTGINKVCSPTSRSASRSE